MKVLILAGGIGSRLSEETELKPKPMVNIGDKPILWHIMMIYSHYGFTDFIILLGYKGYVIKEYFMNYYLHQSDVTIDLCNNTHKYFNNSSEPWKVTLIETGLQSMTGGRILRAKPYLGNEPFMLTYGDGVADVNIKELLDFHKMHKKAITMTTVQPEGRFGSLKIDINNSRVDKFLEKPKGDGNWINGGFFICEPKVFDYINEGDATIFERNPLENLAQDGELYAYMHEGFWQSMDTLRDKKKLEELISKNKAPWIKWQ
ncbi:MAG: glucose-1-phosphate cytidylyltransferase [Bacteroidales bacterium]|nr:glucose-1-phosphate cytidylyltransferase [Bacteroidales bacterium]